MRVIHQDRAFSSCWKSPFQNKGKLEVFDIESFFSFSYSKSGAWFLYKETFDNELNLTVVSVSSLVSRGLSTGSEE